MSRLTSQQKRLRLKRKIRTTLSGTAAIPRFSVFRSNKHIYAQLIDDDAGATMFAASDATAKTGTKSDGAVSVGKKIAADAKGKGITKVVFDRNGFRYAGRIKALADAARAEGLEF